MRRERGEALSFSGSSFSSSLLESRSRRVPLPLLRPPLNPLRPPRPALLRLPLLPPSLLHYPLRLLPGAVPGVLPGAVPGAVPGVLPGVLPGAVPDVVPDVAPGALTGTVPGIETPPSAPASIGIDRG